MEQARLVLDALRLASSLLAFARQGTQDEATLKAIVAKARSEGREVGPADVAASIQEMDDASTALEAKLLGT